MVDAFPLVVVVVMVINSTVNDRLHKVNAEEHRNRWIHKSHVVTRKTKV